LSLKQYTPGENFEVIVVDNGSSDETNTHCPIVGQNLFGQQFKYIRLERNINFGPACNLGAKKSQSHFLFFLNNDTLVTENWLPPLLNAFDEDKNLGAVGPLLLYPDNTVQHLGIAFTPLKKPFHLYQYFLKDHAVVRNRYSLQAITGAAFLIPKIVFNSCGRFYEDYQNGYEDIDICIQIGKIGKKLGVVAKSIVYHLSGQTPRSSELNNIALFAKRCWTEIKPDMHIFLNEDGYDLELSYLFNPIPKLSVEKENFYLNSNRQLDFDHDWYCQMIKKEPFWFKCYVNLLGFYIGTNQYGLAEDILNKANYFFPREILLPLLEKISFKIDTVKWKTKIAKIKQTLKVEQEMLVKENVINYLKGLIKEDEKLKIIVKKVLQKYYNL